MAQDLHAQGRRRHHLALVRRPGRQGRPHTEAYGALDEATSALGRRARDVRRRRRLAADILRLQNELFVAGAELATAPEARDRLEPGVSTPRRRHGRLARGARSTPTWPQVDLPPKFVIPGGTELSAPARRRACRAAPRRAPDRRAGAAPARSRARPSPRYVNRASDLLFAMARFADEPDPELFEGRERSRRSRPDEGQATRREGPAPTSLTARPPHPDRPTSRRQAAAPTPAPAPRSSWR